MGRKNDVSETRYETRKDKGKQQELMKKKKKNRFSKRMIESPVVTLRTLKTMNL